jgi:hypothetical protein
VAERHDQAGGPAGSNRCLGIGLRQGEGLLDENMLAQFDLGVGYAQI